MKAKEKSVRKSVVRGWSLKKWCKRFLIILKGEFLGFLVRLIVVPDSKSKSDLENDEKGLWD